MGTHPIFESDSDCLTGINPPHKNKMPLIKAQMPTDNPEVLKDAESKLQKGIYLSRVVIKAEHSERVVDAKDGGDAGTQIVQADYWGGENQIWNIQHDNDSGKCIIFSWQWPDCCLDTKDGWSVIIDKYQKGKMSQLWTFKENFFFNQGKVMDVEGARKEHATPIIVYPRKAQGNANQKFHIMTI